MAKAICLQMNLYMIQNQQQCLKVKETSLVMTQCPRKSVLSSTTMDWRGFAVLTFFMVRYWLLGCYHPSIRVQKEANNFFLLPSQMLMPEAGVAKGTHQDWNGNP